MLITAYRLSWTNINPDPTGEVPEEGTGRVVEPDADDVAGRRRQTRGARDYPENAGIGFPAPLNPRGNRNGGIALGELVTIDVDQKLTAAEIRAQVNLIQQVMKSVMKENVHYGTISGCDKPTLYKPGSEILLTTFQIAVMPEVEDLSTPDEARYRVLTKGVYRRDGTVVGVGIGECSSNEEKYKWRRAVCDEEWDETPEDRRRMKWCKGYWKNNKWYEPYQVKQVRTEIADVANTVLKMAKKRSQIDLTLTSTAASDIFTQDIEDLPEEFRDTIPDEGIPEQTISKPEPKKDTSTDKIPSCKECGGPIAQSAEDAAKVIAWCKSRFDGVYCRTCQQKAKKK